MHINQRQSIIIWVNSLKYVKYFRRFGNIHYVSKRLKYIVVYMDMSEVNDVIKKIRTLPFVKKVEKSYKPFLKTEFEQAKDDFEKEKQYEYKMGL